MRDYLAELTEYAKRAAPICGWPTHTDAEGRTWTAVVKPGVGVGVFGGPDTLVELHPWVMVALCESHLIDELARMEGTCDTSTFSDGSAYCETISAGVEGESILLALIEAVEATKRDHISAPGNMVQPETDDQKDNRDGNV